MPTIDLSKCVLGQKLRSTQGEILTYVRALNPAKDYYDHEVKYPDGTLGTRINDGHEYRKFDKRRPDDHNIIEILPLDK